MSGRIGWVAFWIAGVLCLFGMLGCASMWQSIKSAAAPAAGGAAGAAVGSLAGPVGMMAGAGAGAAFGDSMEENASLRSGETIGSEALDKQAEFWKGRAVKASEAVSIAQQANDALTAALKLALAGIAAWFLWRNRHNIRDLGLYNGLKHSLFGGGVGKAIGH